MPFKPGQSGNPGGRPKKGWTWAETFQKAVEETNKKGIQIKDVIARNVVKEAVKANMDAVKVIQDRMEGKPVQPIGGTNNSPLEIVFKHKNDS